MKNLPEILRQFNWIDIFCLLLSIRIVYISFKNGLKVEFFKILGTLLALYVSLHYYSSLSALINTRIFNNDEKNLIFDTVSFILLAGAGYGLFLLLRILTGKVMHSEVNARLDKFAGLALGICRAAAAVSLALCVFLVSSSGYFRKSIHSSFSGSYVARIAPDAYVCFWNGFASKLQKNEKLNPSVKDLTKI